MFSNKQCADAIRILSMDGVESAKSGHPGMPMGMADIAEVLWRKHLVHNPRDPHWMNRDRFVLSNGHGSMLLYSLLHLTGYDVSIDDLAHFRQLHSKTPGHPEKGYTPGVETTTGPLGQGIANAVGFALAEKMLSTEFNKPDFNIIDHYTYCFVGDGCLMEGISHEVASLAGTWQLSKLIVFYDDNGISIDGEVEGWFTDNTPKRFESYNWHVIQNVDGHDATAIDNAIIAAKKASKPTLICCKTTIGHGSPNKAGSHSCHGAPLGLEEISLVKQALGVDAEPFSLPDGMYNAWNAKDKGLTWQTDWDQKLSHYAKLYPQAASELQRRLKGTLPEAFLSKKKAHLQNLLSHRANIASRKASESMINQLKSIIPELIGGSADLAPSNLTQWKEALPFSHSTPQGQYLPFGVREFGMAAIANGVSAYGMHKIFAATFLMFMEYARNAIRMSALMKLPNIFVFTHDSIGLGEDGPTHQPIEQIANLRATPNLDTWRPCDEIETAVAWYSAVEQSSRPSALCFSRQSLSPTPQTSASIENIEKGGYILLDSKMPPSLILMSSGSEVQLALSVASQLSKEQGLNIRVVSIPCFSRFQQQPNSYRDKVLPPHIRHRFAIEAGCSQPWYEFVGLDGRVFGIDSFGESGKAEALYEHFELTQEEICKQILSDIGTPSP